MGLFQKLFGLPTPPEKVPVHEEEQPKKYVRKYHLNIPPRETGRCVCGCKGKKWTYERDHLITIENYKYCPARLARKFNEKRAKLVKKQKQLDQWSMREEEGLAARSREEAETRGLKTFKGKKCKDCGSTVRNLGYSCKNCFDAERKLRDAMRRGAYPEDLTKSERKAIVGIYEKCRSMSEETGIPHHVDHIKPLSKGGRHHPSNLQIITADENLRKGAKWEGLE